jgi:hypothetical protein
MLLKKISLILVFFLFWGCSGEEMTSSSTSNPNSNNTNTVSSSPLGNITLLGNVTYDAVLFKNTNSAALDYNNIIKKPVRGALVEVLNASGTVLASTSTDESGNYTFNLNEGSVKVRVYAKLYKAPRSGESSWDFQVKDNTNGNALYVMEGSLASLGTTGSQTRNLHASSGWGGSSYTGQRVAAPFSILDVTYQSMQKVLEADSRLVFPALNIFWSKDNRSGTIGSSHYDSDEVALYILGHEDTDTDEYDVTILAHEWGHYYEDQFSRTDSIGGKHSPGDILDIRLAFGEGFATAFGALTMETPYYQDSASSQQQGTLVAVNIEDGGSTNNPGWFSETSIYHMIYDVYDSADDIGDSLSLPFSTLHDLLINRQKYTPAYTSIFTYIMALKEQNPAFVSEIDAITSNESIAPIIDIYGTGRSNKVEHANPLYNHLPVNGSISIEPNYSARAIAPNNALGVYNLVKFKITAAGLYTISASSTRSGTNLDFYVYREGESGIAMTSSSFTSYVSGSAHLDVGEYRMHLLDHSRVSGTTFNVTLNLL